MKSNNRLQYDKHHSSSTSSSSHKYYEIGAGACGTVFEVPGFSPYQVAKLQHGMRIDGFNLHHDYLIHTKIEKAFRSTTSIPNALNVAALPRVFTFIETANSNFWLHNQNHFPWGPDNVLFTERIPPISRSGREFLIQKFCSETLKKKSLRHEGNEA